jgi:antitoxin MazE
MRTYVQKWGNSLALRIPKSFAVDSKLSLDSEVELSLENGRLIITPVSSRRARLLELISQITEENRHPEIDTGGPVGNEIW